MKVIYLDYAATTPTDPKVIQAMLPYFSLKYGNPSEYHLLGREAKKAIELARRDILSFFKTKSHQLIFTASASESINLAIKGLVEKNNNVKPHLITSSIEHKAILETCKHLEKSGQADVTYLPVNKEGLINLESIGKAIRPNTILISIMYVNNEVGTIQPLKEIAQLLKQLNQNRSNHIYLHTDATQAIGNLDCEVNKLGIDLLSFSGHKIYAPKGIGGLLLPHDLALTRQTDGGGQERSLRAGTENVAYIVGLAKSIKLINLKKTNQQNISQLKQKLIKGVLAIPGVSLTSPVKFSSPHIASFLVKGVEGEALVLALSDYKIMASTGSACSSGDLKPSHVLTAMGYSQVEAHGSLRFSLGKYTTPKDIAFTIEVLPKIINKLRKMSPLS